MRISFVSFPSGVVALCLLAALSLVGPSLAGQPQAGRPYAYLCPAAMSNLAERLQREGGEVLELREDIDLDVTVYDIEQVVRDADDGGRGGVTFETRSEQQSKRFEAGTMLVKAGREPNETVRRFLEPDGRKGRRTQRLLGRPTAGQVYPVYQLGAYVPLTLGQARPLEHKREFDKPITFETVYGPQKRANFNGSPVGGLTWLSDGEHYLQRRDGKLYKVHAVSGRSTLFVDPNALAAGLRRLPAMRPKDIEAISKQTWLTMSPDHSAVLIDYEDDLYYCTLDGSMAVRLTSTPGREEESTFDPQGRFVAFVKEGNLYVGGRRDTDRTSPDHRRRRPDSKTAWRIGSISKRCSIAGGRCSGGVRIPPRSPSCGRMTRRFPSSRSPTTPRGATGWSRPVIRARASRTRR
jgi:hypothetical protein